jgi:hypothetical protein
MKPAGKGGFAELDDLASFGMLDADVEGLESGEHGGTHGSADKLPDADFFNGARARRARRRDAARRCGRGRATLGWRSHAPALTALRGVAGPPAAFEDVCDEDDIKPATAPQPPAPKKQ